MNINSILFDLDGTIIDSMDYHYKAWFNTLLKFNIKLKKNFYFPLEGMSLNLLAEKIFFENQITFNQKKIIEIVKQKKLFYINYANNIKIYYGVNSFLNLLKNNNFKIGIVTSSHQDQVSASFKDDFLSIFDIIITGDMTKKNKPHPAPYLLAAKKLKVKNNECIVFENAPLGIESAKKAQMFCVGISSTNKKEDLHQADIVIDQFKNIHKNKKIKKLLKIYEKI